MVLPPLRSRLSIARATAFDGARTAIGAGFRR